MTAKADWRLLRDIFPIVGKILERQVLRIEALRKLKELSQEEDESEQLQKLGARETLKALIRLEEWR